MQSPGPSTSSTRTPPGGRSPNAAGSASLTGGGVGSGGASGSGVGALESTVSPLENAALRGSGGGAGATLPLDTSSTFLGFNDWVSEESESDIMAQVNAAVHGLGRVNRNDRFLDGLIIGWARHVCFFFCAG